MKEYYNYMKTSLSQYAAGVCVVAFGALLLLDKLHITDNALGMWWPLLLIIIGVVTSVISSPTLRTVTLA